jgi:hypothetical protein
MLVKIITKMALKQKYVGGVEGWRDADDSICFDSFFGIQCTVAFTR